MNNPILKPLKTKIKQYKIASFDVETQNRDNDFLLVGVYHDDKYEVFFNEQEFYDYVKMYLRGYLIVATNLQFDLTASFFNTEHWGEFEIISNGGLMLLAENKQLGVKFIDTLNYHKASVNQLGQILGKPKLEHPSFLGLRNAKNEMEMQELVLYNKQDCVISHDFVVWFQKQINEMGGELKITIASTSLDIWKRKFLHTVMVKEDYIMKKRCIDVNIKNKLFNAYYGGRTEVIQRGTFENLEYYDFNSLYPSVMIEGLPLPQSVQYFENGKYSHIKIREGVSKVTIEHITDELPLLPYRQDSRLLFPSGKFTGWYTHIEIREAIQNGYVLHTVHETISYSRKFKPFEDYITTLYAKRKIAKKNKSTEQLIYKLLMNSLYGKFGERKHHVTDHFDMKIISKEQRQKIEELNKAINLNNDGKGYVSYEEECNSSHVFPILPIYITALGRIKLWRKARLLNPIYMDTDSIVTKQKIPFGKELGELDHEHHIDFGIFIKPKMYYIRDGEKEIIKVKGLPHATKKDFYDILNGLSIKYEKFVKLKEGIRRNLKINSVINVSKLMNLDDIKRSWGAPFSLKPQKSKARCMNEKTSIIRNENYERVHNE